MQTRLLSKSKIQYPILFLAILISCKQSHQKVPTNPAVRTTFTLFSKNVKDSFYISVQLPLEYDKKSSKRYPVVVVTDANFFYPMLGPVIHQYEKGGLLPPMILVGIGYKSFEAMNSLRVRDYLYPKAIPSDEMKAVGGGQRFYRFITGELLPLIDKDYRTQHDHRSLLGHSFGGYFSLYALLEQLNTGRNDFSNFVSASPSLWYNHNYLFQLPAKLNTSADSVHLHLSVGSLEDPKWAVTPVKHLSAQMKALQNKKLTVNTIICSELDHMDVGLISYIKGLEDLYNNTNK